jgi:hypothetical protein
MHVVTVDLSIVLGRLAFSSHFTNRNLLWILVDPVSACFRTTENLKMVGLGTR